jgi:CBS domain-containing protein
MPHRTVQTVMTPEVVTALPHTTFKEIVELFHRNDITSVPVVDAENRPLGLVSEADLLDKEAGLPDAQGHEPRAWLHPGEHRRAEAETAAGLMSKPAITARPEWTIVEAARAMGRRKLKRLPVVDESGRLVGIVSRCDLLELFLRPDADIRAEITDDVLARTLLLRPNSVGVSVQEGVVTLNGTVEQKSLIPIVERLCRSVDGVVSVHQTLEYTFDDTHLHAVPPPAVHGILPSRKPHS